MKKSILGVIVARGGSKRVPRKNIRKIAGKPLIYYTIKAGVESRMLTRLIVSSEDKEIIEYAKELGLGVPFVRPKELALDHIATIDVILHALEYLEQKENVKYDYACILEPTSPLRNSVDIDTALGGLLNSDYDCLISLSPAPSATPYRIRYIEKGHVKLAFKEQYYDYSVNKGKYPKAYIPGGGIFCAKVEAFRRERDLMPGKAMPYVMPFHRGIDINDMSDFFIAEAILRHLESGNSDGSLGQLSNELINC